MPALPAMIYLISHGGKTGCWCKNTLLTHRKQLNVFVPGSRESRFSDVNCDAKIRLTSHGNSDLTANISALECYKMRHFSLSNK